MTDSPHPTENQPPASDNPASPPNGNALVRASAMTLLGVAAAVLGYAAMEAIGDRLFQVAPELAAKGGPGMPPEVADQFSAAELEILYKHSAVWMAVVGALMGGLLATGLGVIRKSKKSICVGLIAGIVFGAAFGAAAGPAGVKFGEIAKQQATGLTMSIPETYIMAMHGSVWLVIGLGVGLACGLSSPEKPFSSALHSSLLAGIAGLLGGVLFPFIGALVLPVADVTIPVPEGNLQEGDWSPLLWMGLPGLLIGLTLGRKG